MGLNSVQSDTDRLRRRVVRENKTGAGLLGCGEQTAEQPSPWRCPIHRLAKGPGRIVVERVAANSGAVTYRHTSARRATKLSSGGIDGGRNRQERIQISFAGKESFGNPHEFDRGYADQTQGLGRKDGY